MRVAVFASRYPARGVSTFAHDVRALLGAGIELEVFAIRSPDHRERIALAAPHDDGPTPTRIHHLTLRRSARPAGVSVRRKAGSLVRDGGAVLASAARAGIGALAKTAYVLPKAWAWAATSGDRFDHVLAYRGHYVATCAYAFHRLLPRRVPFSIWIHGGRDLRGGPALLRHKVLHADHVITCCEANRRHLARCVPDLREAVLAKTHVCHHGLDLSAFPYEPEGRTPRHVVAVTRLARGQGLEYLLRAVFLLRVRGIDVTVELVGDGPLSDRLRSLAVGLGIADRARFRGDVPAAEARRAMREAAVLVHPGVEPAVGVPGAVREAMALGTPVIGSRVGGVLEALDGGCGVPVPPADEVSLADAVASLLADTGRRCRISARARARAEERFDLRRTGARLARLLAPASAAARPDPITVSAPRCAGAGGA